MSTSFTVQLPRSLHDAMLAQAVAELPNECCGLLAGAIATGGPIRITHRYPLRNAADSPVSYQADPRDLLLAHKAMRSAGVELVAIYHSHPTSAPLPSRTDHQQNYWGAEVVHFIISLMGPQPQLRGWRLDGGTAHEAPFEIV